MTSILQINLNHCKAAQDLLHQTVGECDVGLVMVSEPYRVPASTDWIASADGSAALWNTGRARIMMTDVRTGIGFVGAKFGSWTAYSCYYSPNRSLGEFEKYLQDLEGSLILTNGDFLLTGDFNAKSASWGSSTTDARGTLLDAFTEQHGLIPINRGRELTCVRCGGGSIVDVTFATKRLAALISEWRVDTASETLSDHRYVKYLVGARTATISPFTKSDATLGWVTNKVDKDRFTKGLRDALAAQDEGEITCPDDLADHLVRAVTTACDGSMPRKKPPNGKRPPTYWWNAEIAAIRRRCVALRRRVQRARRRRGHVASPEMEMELREARKSLKRAIAKSKEQAWDDLIQEVGRDPWGRPYKLVMKRFKGQPPATQLDPGTLDSVVEGLFPQHPDPEYVPPPMDPEDVPGVTQLEMMAVMKRVRRSKKAPGPDRITSVVWNLVHCTEPVLLTSTLNYCLRGGVFPRKWKEARLVLLRKGSKPEGLPSSYRPLCLLNDVGKIFERILVARLEDHLERRGGLADAQFGFRKKRSTCDAAMVLYEDVSKACNAREYCAAVSLDVRNAFNSIPFGRVLGALERLEVPSYILHIMRNYFQERIILYETRDGETRRRRVQAGVPQGSVLGPLLWNIMFDELLRVPLPSDVKLICYADDTLVVASGYCGEVVEEKMTMALAVVARWMSDAGLELAVQKTECVGFSHRYKYWPRQVTLLGQDLKLQPAMAYLGLQIERNFSFRLHLETAASKAAGILTSLRMLMPNTKGPDERVRRMYSAVIHSILLYGAPLWASSCFRHGEEDVGPTTSWIRPALAVQRLAALRCIRGYRTVSYEAAGILAGIPPLDLLARERQEQFCIATGRTARPVALSKRAVREWTRARTLARWKKRLETAEKGEWTRRLVGDIAPWMGRQHGLMSHQLTQVMTGHGCFGKYLYRIQKVPSPSCVHCRADMDDAEHTLFHCVSWEEQRRDLERKLPGSRFEPTNMVFLMLQDKKWWDAVQRFAHLVMDAKLDAERERQKRNGTPPP
jgi:hypothetical protein